MLDSARLLYRGESAATQPNFNPSYRYLRATVDGRVLYMVLGYIDQRAEGPVEVWYSGTGEVVRLLNGQLVGTTGLSIDWRDVRLANPPAWQAHTANTPQTYARERDLMPGYRFGIRDDIARTSIAPPTDSALAGVPASALRWYEERSVSRPATASVPPARFGVSFASGTPQVVYSEQCISRDLCMSFEQWTPHAPAAGAAARAGT
ncbi:YjbF family lipoprotein [Variovorax boronicumulans]|uniref:YjbF family lipoprotein n=1 Tax=Variovorax boronicumulans TaxID=436515 RepID=UPI00085C7DE4|nr:YjbF family lipoprotein [Variovorax boronicumulans]